MLVSTHSLLRILFLLVTLLLEKQVLLSLVKVNYWNSSGHPPYFGSGGIAKLLELLENPFTPYNQNIGSGILYAFSGAAESTSIGAVSGGLFKFGSEAYTLFSLLHLWLWCYQSYWCWCRIYFIRTYWFWFSQKTQWCSRICDIQSTGKTNALLLYRSWWRSICCKSSRRRSRTSYFWYNRTRISYICRYNHLEEFLISGEGDTDRTRVYIGSGSFKKFSGASESITFNPLEKQMLFSFMDLVQKYFCKSSRRRYTNTYIWRSNCSGTSSRTTIRKNSCIWRNTVSRTRSFIGSGTFKKFSGVAESITFNPLERQLLFSFTGTGSENTVAVPPKEMEDYLHLIVQQLYLLLHMKLLVYSKLVVMLEC